MDSKERSDLFDTMLYEDFTKLKEYLENHNFNAAAGLLLNNYGGENKIDIDLLFRTLHPIFEKWFPPQYGSDKSVVNSVFEMLKKKLSELMMGKKGWQIHNFLTVEMVKHQLY